MSGSADTGSASQSAQAMTRRQGILEFARQELLANGLEMLPVAPSDQKFFDRFVRHRDGVGEDEELAVKDQLKPSRLFGPMRLWRDKSSYQTAVLREIASSFPNDDFVRLFADLEDDANKAFRELDGGPARAKVFDLVCSHPAKLVAHLAASRSWQMWAALWGAVLSTPSQIDDIEVGEVVRESNVAATRQLTERYAKVLQWAGFEGRQDRGVDAFGQVITGLVHGLALQAGYAQGEDLGPGSSTIDEASTFTALPDLAAVMALLVDFYFDRPE